MCRLAAGKSLLEELVHGEREKLDVTFCGDKDVRRLDGVDGLTLTMEVIHKTNQVVGSSCTFKGIQSTPTTQLVRLEVPGLGEIHFRSTQ